MRFSLEQSWKFCQSAYGVFALKFTWLSAVNPNWFPFFSLGIHFTGTSVPRARGPSAGCSLNCWSWTNKLNATDATDFYSSDPCWARCRTHRRHSSSLLARLVGGLFGSFVRCDNCWLRAPRKSLKTLSLPFFVILHQHQRRRQRFSFPFASKTFFFLVSNWKKENLNQNELIVGIFAANAHERTHTHTLWRLMVISPHSDGKRIYGRRETRFVSGNSSFRRRLKLFLAIKTTRREEHTEIFN